MEKYVVTITRQFGSLGRSIASKMGEILGVEFYDRDLVDAAAKKMKLPISTVSKGEESAGNDFFKMIFPLGNNKTEMQDEIFAIQKKMILDLADKESCIIVGRCSDYILKDYPNHINIYIYAPYENRFQNCINILNMKCEEAKSMIREVDKARRQYHLRYAKYAPENLEAKNILIDSSSLGVDGTAEYLAELVKRKFQ